MSRKKINKQQKLSVSPADSWKSMLEAYPIRNVAASTEKDRNTGSLRIGVPTKPDWWYKIPPISWAVRPKKERIILLDQRGVPLWEMCDGKTSVEEIIVFFAQKHNLTFHESRISVTTYIKLLVERGALAVAL